MDEDGINLKWSQSQRANLMQDGEIGAGEMPEGQSFGGRRLVFPESRGGGGGGAMSSREGGAAAEGHPVGREGRGEGREFERRELQSHQMFDPPPPQSSGLQIRRTRLKHTDGWTGHDKTEAPWHPPLLSLYGPWPFTTSEFGTSSFLLFLIKPN